MTPDKRETPKPSGSAIDPNLYERMLPRAHDPASLARLR